MTGILDFMRKFPKLLLVYALFISLLYGAVAFLFIARINDACSARNAGREATRIALIEIIDIADPQREGEKARDLEEFVHENLDPISCGFMKG